MMYSSNSIQNPNIDIALGSALGSMIIYYLLIN
jgi:hypothetical protein